METLDQRLEADGPLPAREAVRLMARLARTVEGLHRAGVAHGRVGPRAVVVPGARLASARLVRPVAAVGEPAMSSPERGPEGDPSTTDDAYAVALLLYIALTAESAEAAANKRRPLAVFDAGDDALQELIDAALDQDPHARLMNLASFREELDAWLEAEGATVDDALPWDEDIIIDDKPLDLSALPPPPRAEPSRRGDPPKRGGPPPLPALHTTLDEESTLPREDDDRATLPANVDDLATPPAKPVKTPKPRLVPPKIIEQKKRKKKAADADAADGSDDVPAFRSPEGAPSEPKAEAGTGPSRSSGALIIGCVAAAGVAIYLFTQSQDPSSLSAPDAASSTSASAKGGGAANDKPPATTPASPSTARPPSSAAVDRPPALSASTPSATASIAPPANPGEPPSHEETCVRAALPSDTFESGWVDLSFVCSESDVVKGANRLREAIVLGGSSRPVTNGMKEWSLLGFFELPAYAVVRDRCCPKAGPPVVPPSPAICKPTMDEAVFAVMQAARKGEVPTDTLAQVDKAARCIVRAKQATSFGQHPKPSGGEGTALRTIANRISKFLKTAPAQSH